MAKKSRAGQRPVPRTIDAWEAEVRGLERLISELPLLKDANGSKWVKSVLTYNKERLKFLRARKPVKA